MNQTIGQILVEATKKLKKAKISTPRLDAEVMLAHLLGWQRMDLIIKDNQPLDQEQWEIYNTHIEERAQGKPVQYITGQQEFMGMMFKVTPDVLIPRPDTEILIEAAIEEAKRMKMPLNIVEIGTGSGAIALSLAHFLRLSSIHTVDISTEAIEIARENAKRLSLDNRVTFYHGDVFTPLGEEFIGKVDLLVSNPPYIPREEIKALQQEVRDYEPSLALDGGEDGLDFYKKIIGEGGKYLSPQGIMIFEVGYDQGKVVSDMIRENSMFEEVIIKQDLAGIDRVVIGKK